MKKLFLPFLLLLIVAPQAHAYRYTGGYIRSNGTYVRPHFSSNADHSRFNNWSTRGNVNPFTGKTGHLNPFGWHWHRK